MKKRNLKLLMVCMVNIMFATTATGQNLVISIDEIQQKIELAKQKAEIGKQSRNQAPSNHSEPEFNDAILSFSPDLLLEIKDELKQEKNIGYVKKKDNREAAWFGQLTSTVQTHFKNNLSEIRDGLAFESSDVRPIQDRGYKLLGLHEAGTLTKNGWTGLVRVYRGKKKQMLVFSEDHYERLINDPLNDSFTERARSFKRQSPSIQIAEKLNYSVAGNEATLRSVESLDGSSISSVDWIKGGINYTITASGNVGKNLHSKGSIEKIQNKKHIRFKLPRKANEEEMEFLVIANEL